MLLSSCRRAFYSIGRPAKRAEVLGTALRLAYTLSAGTKDLLAGTQLRVQGPRLVLQLRVNSGVFAGESVIRRLERLAQALELEAMTDDGGFVEAAG